MASKIIDDDIFLKERVLFMEEEFDEDSCNYLKKQLLWLMTHDEKKPVTIYISSYGGDVYDFLQIYGLLKRKKFHLTTIAVGKCMSAGAYLLMMGDTRRAYPGSRIMFHELTANSYGKLNEQEIDVKESKQLMKILYNLCEEINMEDIEEWLQKDQYLSVKEALKINVLNKRL